MSEDPLDTVAHLLARRVGLRLDPAIRSRLIRAVRDEADRRGGELNDYAATLEHDHDAMQDLLNRVTVQETSFFRDPAQFEALASHVLPALRSRGGPVRVWSAGCANGQEAYSMAMILSESGLPDWHVVASDISTNALERTRAARYSERELAGLTPVRRARHVAHLPADDAELSDRGELVGWEISPTLRSNVDVIRHNLVADAFPFARNECDIVLCRNVLIYFGRDEAITFLDRLAGWLPPHAHLLLGYSESLWQVTDRFDLIRLGRAFVYRPCTQPVRRPLSPPPTPRIKHEATPPPRSSSPPPQPSPSPPPTPQTADLLAEGEAALDRGDHAAAVRAFRQAVYLDADEPIAYLNLALTLEASGDEPAAVRAYAAARAAFDRCESPELEATLQGYHLDELLKLLDTKVVGKAVGDR